MKKRVVRGRCGISFKKKKRIERIKWFNLK